MAISLATSQGSRPDQPASRASRASQPTQPATQWVGIATVANLALRAANFPCGFVFGKTIKHCGKTTQSPFYVDYFAIACVGFALGELGNAWDALLELTGTR